MSEIKSFHSYIIIPTLIYINYFKGVLCFVVMFCIHNIIEFRYCSRFFSENQFGLIDIKFERK